MPQLTSVYGRAYDVDGKTMTWHPEPWDGEPVLPDVRLPLRMKVGRLRALAERYGGEGNIMRSNQAIVDMIELIAPGQLAAVDEMDTNDMQDMAQTWLRQYNTLNGTSLGEPSASSPS